MTLSNKRKTDSSTICLRVCRLRLYAGVRGGLGTSNGRGPVENLN